MEKFKERNLPVGVIDSGVGGLTVLKWLQEKMPHENFIYLGDTARCPYGNAHSEDEILVFAAQMVDTLAQKGVKAIVVACNTISMLGKDNLRFGLELPIITMSLGEKILLETSQTKHIGLLATPFTIGKELHSKAIMAADPQARVTMVPCPDFVPLIEEEKFGSLRLRMTVSRYCKDFKNTDIDTIMLACTHYPFIRKEIETEMGNKVQIVDPAEQTAQDVIDTLGKDLLLTTGEGKTRICSTADVSRTRRLAERVLNLQNCEFSEIKLVDL